MNTTLIRILKIGDRLRNQASTAPLCNQLLVPIGGKVLAQYGNSSVSVKNKCALVILEGLFWHKIYLRYPIISHILVLSATLFKILINPL